MRSGLFNPSNIGEYISLACHGLFVQVSDYSGGGGVICPGSFFVRIYGVARPATSVICRRLYSTSAPADN